jgi:hypothetical protein
MRDKVKIKELKYMKKPGYTFKEKLLKMLSKDPLMILKVLAFPPVAIRLVTYFMGSAWPMIYFASGCITTIIIEVLFILWFLNKSKKEELIENL